MKAREMRTAAFAAGFNTLAVGDVAAHRPSEMWYNLRHGKEFQLRQFLDDESQGGYAEA